MSVVVAVTDGETVCIGADSLVADGDDDAFERKNPPKCFRWEPFVMGVVESLRVNDIVYGLFEPPRIARSVDPYQYMVESFVPALRKTLRENSVAMEWHHDSGSSFYTPEDFRMVVGVRGRLFVVESTFAISEPTDAYTAIGAGDVYALGSLYSTRAWKRPKDRVRTALQAASKYASSVGGALVIEQV